MRPDDQRFSAFTSHLTALDPKLDELARVNELAVEINAFYQPCRYLRRRGNPHLLIVVELDRDWRTSEIGEYMEHNVAAIGYYYPPDDPASVWRETEIIAKSIPFSELQTRPDGILQEALVAINGFSSESIVRTGVREENLRFTFRDYYEGGHART